MCSKVDCRALTYLDGTEDPQHERLYDDKCSRSNPKGEINADILSYIRVPTEILVDL
jgi:hypothetical protein